MTEVETLIQIAKGLDIISWQLAALCIIITIGVVKRH